MTKIPKENSESEREIERIDLKESDIEEMNLENKEDTTNKETSDELTDEDKWHKREEKFEKFFFSTRWILAPMYVVLILILLMILIRFGMDVIDFIYLAATNSLVEDNDWIIRVLELLDLTLVANLVLIVAFSGYENFVSKMDVTEDHRDRLHWMGQLDFSGLKLKIIGSVVAISLIELLQDFLNISAGINNNVEIWRILLHLVFLLSGYIFARMEVLSEKRQEMQENEKFSRMENKF